jgi:hypothetical protein
METVYSVAGKGAKRQGSQWRRAATGRLSCGAEAATAIGWCHPCAERTAGPVSTAPPGSPTGAPPRLHPPAAADRLCVCPGGGAQALTRRGGRDRPRSPAARRGTRRIRTGDSASLGPRCVTSPDGRARRCGESQRHASPLFTPHLNNTRLSQSQGQDVGHPPRRCLWCDRHVSGARTQQPRQAQNCRVGVETVCDRGRLSS